MKIMMPASIFPRWENDTTRRFAYDLSKDLVNRGHEIHVIAPHDIGSKTYEQMEGIHVYRFKYFYPSRYQRLCYGAGIPENIKESILAKIQAPLLYLFGQYYLLKLTRKIKPDLIHAHWILPQGLEAFIASRIFKIPYIISVHGGSIPLAQKLRIVFLLRFVVNKSNKTIANSSDTKKVLEQLGCRKDKIETIHVGVDPSKFSLEFDCSELKEKHCIGEHEQIVLSVGRLVEKKGTRYLIQAFKELLMHNMAVRLIIVGSGPLEDQLKNRTKEVGIEKSVVFASQVSMEDLLRYYAMCDVFVLPSIVDSMGDKETLGVVLLEAMSCNKPVIGTNVGGIPDIIANGENGFLVPEKNTKRIAEKLLILLNDRALAEKMGACGRKKIDEEFSWAVIAERVEKIYVTLHN